MRVQHTYTVRVAYTRADSLKVWGRTAKVRASSEERAIDALFGRVASEHRGAALVGHRTTARLA